MNTTSSSPESGCGNRKAILILLGVLALVVLVGVGIALVLLTSGKKASGEARTEPAVSESSRVSSRNDRMTTLNNLRQIGQACMLYGLDHDEAFPARLGDVLTYVPSTPRLFLAAGSATKPGSMDDVDTWADFQLVPLSGFPLNASGTILAFTKPHCFPDGGGLLFADGHVEWIDGKDAFEARIAPYRR